MQIQKLLLLLAAALFTAVAAPCAASSTRGEVLLDNDTIALGDVFDVSGDLAKKVVARAPEPGSKVVYDVSAIAQIARAFSVDWKQKSNYERVTITRASQTITASAIHDKIVEALATVTSDRDLDVALDNQSLEVHRPLKSSFETQISDMKYDPIQHRFSGNLVVSDKSKEGAAAEIIPLAGRAMPMMRVAMLVHAVAAGDVLSEGDLEWVRVPLDKAGADVVSEPSQLIGTEIRRAMNADMIVRTRDLIKERMITKGSLVVMQVDTPALHLTAQGRAMGDGAMGDTIRVTNIQSNRTIDAVIIGKDKVSVVPVTTATVAAR